jgi:hypothetical protein
MAITSATGSATITAGSSYDIKPGSGVEWIIHNIIYGGTTFNATIQVDIILVDGATVTYFDRDTSQGGLLDFAFHLTNTHFIRVTNSGSVSVNVNWNGVVSS